MILSTITGLAALGQDAEIQTDFRLDPSNEVVHFQTDVSEVLVPIAIVNDALLESNETFEVLLHSPSNGYLDDRRSTVITVIDDEGRLSSQDTPAFSHFISKTCSFP